MVECEYKKPACMNVLDERSNLTRREFLKVIGIGGSGLICCSTMDLTLGMKKIFAESRYPYLTVVRGKNPAKITRCAIDAVGGMKKFVSRGDIVVVKPNMAWDRLPSQAANTNPSVVETVAKMAFESGAKRVKVFDNPCNNERRVHTNSGIAEACRNVGADVSYIDKRKFKTHTIHGENIKKWPVYTDILDADKVINVPIAKHHSSAGLTMSMKNWFGGVGGRRGRLHLHLHQNIADLCTFFRPNLIVLDATRILIANGPSGGDLKDVKIMNTIIVGTDQVAVDAYGATLFEKSARDIDYIANGARMELGRIDIEKLFIQEIEV